MKTYENLFFVVCGNTLSLLFYSVSDALVVLMLAYCLFSFDIYCFCTYLFSYFTFVFLIMHFNSTYSTFLYVLLKCLKIKW